MKRKIMILFALGCMTVLGAGAVTYAYLTDDDVKQNEIRAAENKVHIEEEFEPPKDPQPGDVIVKKPWVVNDSKIPVYVRIRVCFSDSRGESQCEPLQIHRKWSRQEDGYYYYENVLAAGEKTEPLFERIQLKPDLIKEEICPFDLLVYTESVQAYGFTNAETAFAALDGGKE